MNGIRKLSRSPISSVIVMVALVSFGCKDPKIPLRFMVEGEQKAFTEISLEQPQMAVRIAGTGYFRFPNDLYEVMLYIDIKGVDSVRNCKPENIYLIVEGHQGVSPWRVRLQHSSKDGKHNRFGVFFRINSPRFSPDKLESNQFRRTFDLALVLDDFLSNCAGTSLTDTVRAVDLKADRYSRELSRSDLSQRSGRVDKPGVNGE